MRLTMVVVLRILFILGSHDLQQMRDMRDAGGALGPVNGINPELQNLTCSLTTVEPGDVVFITSDGISDNCDPVVGKFCIPNDFNVSLMNDRPVACAGPASILNSFSPFKEKLTTETLSQQFLVAHNGFSTVNGIPRPPDSSKITANRISAHGCVFPEFSLDAPAVTSEERHELMLLRMEDILKHGVGEENHFCETAKDLCYNLVQFATLLTRAKRRVLEDPELYKRNPKTSSHDIKVRRRMVRCKVMELPGKLDHASVVAYTVGSFGQQHDVCTSDTENGKSVPFTFDRLPWALHYLLRL
ncbi:unnamed protein product [Soboliphyme baturini]|uniref:Protein-serine/threonine phosphatase n=1 Tax=Soboliphyme baturini TaxID=241478 RepID=A0A183J8F2_9BILA|nr:unnamed protein product [Soboliphyme baturini]